MCDYVWYTPSQIPISSFRAFPSWKSFHLSFLPLLSRAYFLYSAELKMATLRCVSLSSHISRPRHLSSGLSFSLCTRHILHSSFSCFFVRCFCKVQEKFGTKLCPQICCFTSSILIKFPIRLILALNFYIK